MALIAVPTLGGTYRGSSAGLRNTPGSRLGSFALASSWSCCSSSLPPPRAARSSPIASSPSPRARRPARPSCRTDPASAPAGGRTPATRRLARRGRRHLRAWGRRAGELTTRSPGGAAAGDAGAIGGVTVGGRRRAKCSGAPPPSRASRGSGDAGSAGAGEVSSKFAWSPGLSPAGPTGEESGAPAACGGARGGAVQRGRGRDGAGGCDVSTWVGWAFSSSKKASRARRKCRSRPEGSDAVGGVRGIDAPAPLAIATVTRGDVRACGVGVAPGDEARASSPPSDCF